MLAQISIRNLAVIEQLSVEFVSGFQVFTGETGAGKSIVIDALGLIVGARGSSELVRHGCDKAEIEAMFDLPVGHPIWGTLSELGIEAEDNEPLIIRRELSSQGKSTARVNGQLVNLTMLREIGDQLVNLHGQHEHQSLLRTDKHLEWLDQYGIRSIGMLKSNYMATYAAYTETLKELEQLRIGIQQALQMGDLYRFQADEIGSAALKPGEDEKLEQERLLLAGGEKLMESVSAAYQGLFGGGKSLELIADAADRLQHVSSYDQVRLQPLIEQIQSAYYQLEDAAFQLRAYRDQLEFEPERLNQVEERLNVIQGLKRKYGATIEDILSHYEKISIDLDRLENQDEQLDQLTKRLEQTKRKLEAEAAALSQARKDAAAALAKEIEAHLRDLNMERTKFTVHFDEVDAGKTGKDRVEFLISANPGEPPRPIHKIASGGELSRIMLALKTIFASIDRIPVLVFDEVDTGVSGKAAQAIAGKLAALSKECQVFSVTHLPQVASMADAHYSIYKEVDGERTYTKVERLADESRVEELARMLGGAQITATTLDHAREMIALARKLNS